MSKLLSDMSSLALLDNPLTDRNMTDTDVTQIIRAVIDDSAISLQQKNIVVKLILPPSATIRGDSWMISSIFRNLVDNAIAYATGATKLTISCLEQMDSYLFRVSDNGIGENHNIWLIFSNASTELTKGAAVNSEALD